MYSLDCKEVIITLSLQTVVFFFIEGGTLHLSLSFCLKVFFWGVFFNRTCLGDSGVWGLKKNFALLELLERLQNGASNQSGVAEEALKGMGEVRHL